MSTAIAPDFDSAFFRTALGRFATGVTIVTAQDAQGQPVGLTVSSFNAVSLNPPLILWSLSLESASRAAFEQCDHYVINVLSAEQIPLARRFAQGKMPERFDGLASVLAPSGTLRLDAPCACSCASL